MDTWDDTPAEQPPPSSKPPRIGGHLLASLLLAGLGLLLAVGAVVVGVLDQGDQATPTVETAGPPPETSQPASRRHVAAIPSTELPATVPEPLSAPSFDVVQVKPGQGAVMAGRGTPGARVLIYADGGLMGEVPVDDRGEWVFVPDAALEPGRHRLTLTMLAPGRDPVRSGDEVIMVVPEPAGPDAGSPAGALTVKVPSEGDGPTTVLQTPTPPAETFEVEIRAVDYDDDGRMIISGHTEAEGMVQLYLDKDFLGQAVADGDGLWSLRPTRTVAVGVYTLRADRVDAAGKVLARMSFPFARAEPVAEMPAGSFVVVQPGASLWRIARGTYGQGTRYTVIFEANKSQIKDPNVIYPGQIFAMPSGE